ncbi:hypothetical protein FHS96_004994 [Sphingomonas zeicaulis]|uniref:hypothetical protein n=1 Tax=Sphingomonas zeicaulis TaxID=1632740 RepID=UPI003D1D81D0
MSAEAIDAIRAVRLAAHGLRNACASITGGTEMALSIESVEAIGVTTRGLAPSPVELRKVRRQ